MVVSEDGKDAIVVTYKTLKTPNVGIDRIKLQGLNPDAKYRINGGQTTYGDYLMEVGIPTQDGEESWFYSDGDFSSRRYILKSEVTN
jgi:alpha-galactosidase